MYSFVKLIVFPLFSPFRITPWIFCLYFFSYAPLVPVSSPETLISTFVSFAMGVLYNHASFATKIIHSRYNMPRIQYNFLFLLCFTNSNITLLPSRIYQKSFFYFSAKNFIVKINLKMIFMLKEQDSTLTRTALFFCSSFLYSTLLLPPGK